MATEQILILFPITGDVEKLNVSKYGLKIYKMDSPYFLEILDDELHSRLENKLRAISHYELEEYCYVVVEKEGTKNLWGFFNLLKMIKPSSVMPIAELSVTFYMKQRKRKKLQIPSTSVWPLDIDKSLDNPLRISGAQIPLINTLLINYFNSRENQAFNKLGTIYFEAITQEKRYLKLLILMMIVESLITGDDNQGISYKIRRLCAVILGSSGEMSQQIFDNVSKIYSVRSKIVHSADERKLTEKMVDYLHYVVCELLNTILISNCEPKTLFDYTTRYGFGDRKKLIKDLGLKSDRRFIDNYSKFNNVL